MIREPRVIAGPDVEPFTLDQCRQHLRIEPYEVDSDNVGHHPDDEWILTIGLPAAREHCENFLGLTLAPCILEVALDAFPTVASHGTTVINLPRGPVREVLQIMTPATEPTSDDVDSDMLFDADVFADGQINPALYVLDVYTEPHCVAPTLSWPAIIAGRNAIKVRYIAGYGETDSDGNLPLPKTFQAAILLVLGHLYEHREDTVEKALQTIPTGAEALMRPKRVRLGMA